MDINIPAMKEKQFIRCGPHLPVRNLKETLTYYRDTLGFYDEWTFGESDGGIRRDSMRLLFTENPRHAELINSRTDRLPLMWFVKNIDEIYKEFQDKNLEIADELKRHPYGLREFSFVDINGYYIRVAESSDVG
jgi:uncharacterized glyoxalase superfamily protein PhnB